VKRREIRQRAETALQDTENKRWSNVELNNYIDDSYREFVRLSRLPQIEESVVFSTTSTTAVTNFTSTKNGDTFTITTPTAHNLVDGDALVVKDDAGEVLGAFIVTNLAATQFSFMVKNTSATPGSYLAYKPDISIPSTIEEVVSVSYDGRELSIVTEGELNSAVYRNSSGSSFIDGVFGSIPNPFSNMESQYSVEQTPKWRERIGPIEAAVINHSSANTFRIFPLPSRDIEIFIDTKSTDKTYKSFQVRGVPSIDPITSDDYTPIINPFYHEALIHGTLERAYMREGQLRNVEKAQVYRAKFLELAMDAKVNEPMNSLTRSEGRNESYFRVVR
jgi:hypothetical protein